MFKVVKLSFNLLLLSLRLVHPGFNQLYKVNFGALRLVVVSDEVRYERLHHAFIFHQIWAQNFFNFTQSQVESSSHKLEKDKCKDKSEQKDDYAADELDAHETKVSRRQKAFILVHQPKSYNAP